MGGPKNRSGRVRKISPPPEFDSRTVHPVASRYTGWATKYRFYAIYQIKPTFVPFYFSEIKKALHYATSVSILFETNSQEIAFYKRNFTYIWNF
jgi:hypothetical protein